MIVEKNNKKNFDNISKEVEAKSRKFEELRKGNPYNNVVKKEALEIKRVVKVTKGGRRFSFTSLVLVKDEEKKAVGFACAGGKEVVTAIKKSSREAQKKLITYFPKKTRTIPRDITVRYKATKIFLKPTPPGSGVKAGGVLNKLFKFLEIEDISAKILGSRSNKLNVMRAAFKALNSLTGKKYDY
jgi:small subunit ribosomal protein S5